MQSLPAALAAIAFVIYGLTFVPLSADRMRRSVALVEYVSCYEINADGHAVAWFRTFGDSLSLNDVSVVAGEDVVDSRLLTACWVNRYDFFPSCHGRLLMPSPDTLGHKILSSANRTPAAVVQRAVNDTEKRIKQLDSKASRLKYYLSIHNVSDDGYNTMAAYAAEVNSSRETEERLLTVLKDLLTKSHLSINHIEKFTLLHSDEQGKTVRTACNDITKSTAKGFRMLQTADKKKPSKTTALYFHRWLAPVLVAGDNVYAASFFGSSQDGFNQNKLSAKLFPGTTGKNGEHGIPPLLAPDGTPVFSDGNRLAGISVGGRVVTAQSFAFGFKDLLE